MRRYQLDLTKEQAITVMQALDLYSRIGMGQIREVVYHCANSEHDPLKRAAARRQAEPLLDDAARVLTDLPAGSYFAISAPQIDNSNRRAYDIQQVIRHRLAWDESPGGGWHREFDKPMPYSGEGLPTIKTVELPRSLHDVRMSRGMTIAVVSDALKISASSLCDYEFGRKVPPEGILKGMSRVYDIPYEHLEEAAKKAQSDALSDEATAPL